MIKEILRTTLGNQVSPELVGFAPPLGLSTMPCSYMFGSQHKLLIKDKSQSRWSKYHAAELQRVPSTDEKELDVNLYLCTWNCSHCFL